MWMLYDGPPQLPKHRRQNGSVAWTTWKVSQRVGWASSVGSGGMATKVNASHHRNIRSIPVVLHRGTAGPTKHSRGGRGTLFEPLFDPLSRGTCGFGPRNHRRGSHRVGRRCRLSRSANRRKSLLPAGIVRV